MVEGDDVAILKPIQNTLFPKSLTPIDTIPSRLVGGWGGWNHAVGSEMFLKNAGGEGIISYCIFDSDYHTAEEIAKRQQEAKDRGISLHIWTRKELENYLLVPSTILRVIRRQLPVGTPGPNLGNVQAELDNIAEQLKEDLTDCLATHIQSYDRKITAGTANQRAREIISKRWKTQSDRLGIICGKQALACISRWAEKMYKVSVGTMAIANDLTPNEIDDELRQVIAAIEETNEFA